MDVRDITGVMAGALIVEMGCAIIALGYVVAVYLRAKPARQSVIFRMLVSSDVIKVLAGVWIGFLAVYRLSDFGVSLPVWTSPISAIVIGILLFPPILHAIVFHRLRKRYGDSSPPPFHAGD